MISLTEKIYFKSPVLLQNIMTSIYGYMLYRERYVGNHDRCLNALLTSQWYSEKKMKEFVDARLTTIFQHAAKNVPFYRELVHTGKIKLDDIRGISDLNKLPIISKEHLREAPQNFLADCFSRRELIVINTSGTTGKTLKIFVDKDSRRYAYAFFSRLKIWAGITNKLANVTFAGRTIVPPDATTPPFWRRNFKMNNYLFSSYHLSNANLKHYVEKLKTIQPHFIDSYPSSLFTLAKYMKDSGATGIHPKALITSSETLLDYQRNMIEEVFQAPIFDQYGCAEQVVFASQCEKGTYHIHPEYGIVEFLNEDGSIAKPGKPARLICTGFTNLAMPLIRYDIGDTGVMSDKKCSCNRPFPVIEKIVGRTDDILVMLDGRHVGRLDPVFKGLKSIKESQIIQEDFDKVLLKIVPSSNFQEKEAQSIVWELKKRLSIQTDIKVEIVPEIPRSAGGKFRAVISKVGSK